MTGTDAQPDLRALLGESVDRLHALVEPLTSDDLRRQAYPSEWTVADVLAHLGSGAVIMARRVDEALGGPAVDPQPVWDEWNAKDPDAKSAGALAADRAFLDRLDALSDEERARVELRMGPMTFDAEGIVRLRLNEHALHSWDVAVTFHPTATVPAEAAAVVFDALSMVAGYTGKPTGSEREIVVHTSAPDADFVVALSADGVAISSAASSRPAQLRLPAEAFVRLVYGRLDPNHTPAFVGDGDDLEELRRAFPGV
jgi:uncharacterized protein (TIGR03083 family)